MKKIPLLVFYCVLTPILVVALAEGVASLAKWARKQQPTAQIPHVSQQSYSIYIGQRAGMMSTNNHVICIGQDSKPTADRQFCVTWEDGTQTRFELPTNKWIRGWDDFMQNWAMNVKGEPPSPEPKDSAPTVRLSQASYFEAGVLCAIEAWSLDAQDPPFGGGTKLRIGWLRGAITVARAQYPAPLTACLTNLPMNRELMREAGIKP